MVSSIPQPVLSVAEARAGLSKIIKLLNEDSSTRVTAFIGSHRKAQVVIMEARNYESFAAESKPAVTLSEVQRLSPIIRKIAASWGLSAVSLFGSVARNEATEQSDVDLLVTSEHGVSLSVLSGFKKDMELILRSEVDVLVRNVNSEVNNRIAAEAIEI
jgi:hypothetical protein